MVVRKGVLGEVVVGKVVVFVGIGSSGVGVKGISVFVDSGKTAEIVVAVVVVFVDSAEEAPAVGFAGGSSADSAEAGTYAGCFGFLQVLLCCNRRQDCLLWWGASGTGTQVLQRSALS